MLRSFSRLQFACILTIAACASSTTEPSTEPSGDVWIPRAPMLTSRKGAVSAVIGGRFFVAGGCCTSLNESHRTVEAYDPSTNTWTAMAQLPTSRYSSVAGLIDGILYVASGLDSTTVEVYNPASDTWTTRTATMHAWRSFATSAVLDGMLYAIGGYHFSTAPSHRSVEAYDPATNRWIPKAPMPVSFAFGAAGVVNGILYVAAGAYLLAYDPTSDTWATRAPMPTPRYGAVSGVLNGLLYVAGGWEASGFTVVGALEVYDPATDTWTKKAQMSTIRAAAVGGVINSVLYVAGGLFIGPGLPSVEAYHP